MYCGISFDNEILHYVLFFILGAMIGSLISAIAYRVPRNEDIFLKRSSCPKCKKNLGFKDLFPILSMLINNFKCRYCKSNLGYYYIIIELLSALMFMLIYYSFGCSIKSVFFIFLFIVLMVVIIIDFMHLIIPNSCQLCLLFLALIHLHICDYIDWYFRIIYALLLLLLFYLLRLIYFKYKNKESIGFGDIKLYTISALFLEQFNQVFILLFLSGAIGIGLGSYWRYVYKSQVFPFGPAIAISLFMILFFGAEKFDFNIFFVKVISMCF